MCAPTPYVPSPEEIAKAAAHIREEWTEEELLERQIKQAAYSLESHKINMSKYQRDTNLWPSMRRKDSFIG